MVLLTMGLDLLTQTGIAETFLALSDQVGQMRLGE